MIPFKTKIISVFINDFYIRKMRKMGHKINKVITTYLASKRPNSNPIYIILLF